MIAEVEVRESQDDQKKLNTPKIINLYALGVEGNFLKHCLLFNKQI